MKRLMLGLIFVLSSSIVACSASNFDKVLNDSVDTATTKVLEKNLNTNLQTRQISNGKAPGESVTEIIAFLAIKVLLPMAVLVGLVFAFIGFYKILTSDKEEEVKKGNQFLIRGTIGVITMVSAGFIANKLAGVGGGVPFANGNSGYGIGGIFGSIGSQGGVVAGQEIAAQIYGTLLFPVIKMLMFVIIGILFIIMFINLFKYLFSPAEDIEKKALTIIIRNVIGILTIVLSKYIIEAIFGKYDTVANQNRFNTDTINIGGIEGANSHLGNIGTPLGDITVNLDMFFTILNRLLGLLTLIILILIIYQGFKLLVNPTDSGGLASVGKTLFYIFLGILVLGLGYIIANAILPVA